MVLFERTAAAGGQLMQVQREHSASESESGKFLLTFDVGRILVHDGGDALVAEHLESSDEIPAGMVNATDEEPWWRLLGSPLVRVWSVPEVSGGSLALRLQFRADDENPRFVSLHPEGGHVRISLDPMEAS